MVLISFDIEEFDAPGEFGHPIPFEQEIAISARGTEAILDLLAKKGVAATFFSTVAFAQQAPSLLDRIVSEGHELASHGMKHSEFKMEDLLSSRSALEELTHQQCQVKGFRMPRMQPVAMEEVAAAGYTYDASLNPTWLPGRYCHLRKPLRPFMDGAIDEFPATVTPLIRFPLFWLSMHHLPQWLYVGLCRYSYHRVGYLSLYFHPWEFVDLRQEHGVKLPYYMTRHSGPVALARLGALLDMLKEEAEDASGDFRLLRAIARDNG